MRGVQRSCWRVEMSQQNTPEIFCDLNAQMTENGYLLTRGSVDDLSKCGLTLESAIGKEFLFCDPSADRDKAGVIQDICFTGYVERNQEFGFLAIQTGDLYWREAVTR